MLGLGLPPKGSYHGAFAHPPTALLHMPPQSGSPTWGKGSVAASSTLQRVLPREVTHVRLKSHIPPLRANDTWGRVPSHLLINLRILGSRGRSLSCSPPPGLVFSRCETTWGSMCYGSHMPCRVLTPPDLVELALSRGAGGFGVVRCCWLVGCVMVELRCRVVFVGMVVGGRGASLLDAIPVSTPACLAGLMLAGLRVVCLWSGRCFCSGCVGAQLS